MARERVRDWELMLPVDVAAVLVMLLMLLLRMLVPLACAVTAIATNCYRHATKRNHATSRTCEPHFGGAQLCGTLHTHTESV